MNSGAGWLNPVWFSPLEQADGTVVGVVLAVDREDGFIEGAVNPSIPGAAEALWGLHPSGRNGRPELAEGG